MAKNNGNGGAEGPEVKRLSDEEFKKLFIAYDSMAGKMKAAKEALEKIAVERSVIIAKIADAGRGRGPFTRANGLVMSIVSRTNKETGEETWFFKSPSEREVVKLDV